MTRYLRTGALAMATAILAGAVGAAATVAQEPVEIDWWHLDINEPGKSMRQQVADEYMAMHPNVKINVTVLENEALKSALAVEMQAGNPPDIFHSWGGGVLAEQVAAGMAQPIDDLIADWADTMNDGAMSVWQVDGVQYGIPYNFGLVGFWYNKDLFEQAGITEPPTTWDEFLADVQALKDAGITPIAVAGQDKWPLMFYYAYLALRIGGQAAYEEAIGTGNWEGDAFIEAGNQLQRLIDLEPFQEGFLAATYNDQAAAVGNGKAAIELMGQWAPAVQMAQSESGEGIGDSLAWFSFPAAEGGVGLPTDIFGGGDGYAIGRDAPPEAVDFLKYLSSEEVAERFAALNTGILPPTEAATDAVTDPTMLTLLDKRGEATFAQLYLDQATTPELGATINDAVQGLFAGSLSSEDVASTITQAAQG
jgi:raffinose/stachyose/melibiose transport system substrate-binding protein